MDNNFQFSLYIIAISHQISPLWNSDYPPQPYRRLSRRESYMEGTIQQQQQ